jgi:hypothetical protein
MLCRKLSSLKHSKGKKLFVGFARRKSSSRIIKSTLSIVKETHNKEHILIFGRVFFENLMIVFCFIFPKKGKELQDLSQELKG